MGWRDLFGLRARPQPAPPAPSVPPAPAWPAMPPVQRSVVPAALVTAPDRFGPGLAAWQDPSLTTGRLGHLVSPDAPGGVAHGVAEPVAPEPAVPVATARSWWRPAWWDTPPADTGTLLQRDLVTDVRAGARSAERGESRVEPVGRSAGGGVAPAAGHPGDRMRVEPSREGRGALPPAQRAALPPVDEQRPAGSPVSGEDVGTAAPADVPASRSASEPAEPPAVQREVATALVQPRWRGSPVVQAQRVQFGSGAIEPVGGQRAQADGSAIAEHGGVVLPVGVQRADAEAGGAVRSAERGAAGSLLGVQRAEDSGPDVGAEARSAERGPAPGPVLPTAGRSGRLDRAEAPTPLRVRLPVVARSSVVGAAPDPDPPDFVVPVPEERPLRQPDAARGNGEETAATPAVPPRRLGLGAPIQRHPAGGADLPGPVPGGQVPGGPGSGGLRDGGAGQPPAPPVAPLVGEPAGRPPTEIADVAGGGPPAPAADPEFAESASGGPPVRMAGAEHGGSVFRPLSVSSGPGPVVQLDRSDAGRQPTGIGEPAAGGPRGPELAGSVFRPLSVPFGPGPVVQLDRSDEGRSPAVGRRVLGDGGVSGEPAIGPLLGRPPAPVPDAQYPTLRPSVQRNAPAVAASRHLPVPGRFESPSAAAAASPTLVQRMPEPPSDGGVDQGATGSPPPLGSVPVVAVQRASDEASPVSPAAATSATPSDVDALVRKLYDPLVRRLKAELRLDRERAGNMLDLRH